MTGVTWSKSLAVTGCALLLACMIWSAKDGVPTATSATCRENLKAVLGTDPTAADNEGRLRIAGVFPRSVSLGSQLCVVVAGVAAKPATAPTAPPPPIDVTLYLNDTLTKLSAKAEAVPGPQMLVYPFGEHSDASSDTAKVWRDLLAGKTRNGTMELSVGASKMQSSSPAALAPETIDFIVYKVPILALGAVAMLVLVAAFAVFAACTTVLRDKPTVDANGKPTGTFSLARTQMALWLILSVAGFVFLWLTLGFYLKVITSAILVLLGINGVTGLAAILIDKPADPANPPPVRVSAGFWEDLVCDNEGAKLQRIQMIVWTSILAVIFAWNVVWNFVFVDFDTNLLLLMGIASSTYLGFKTQEKA